MKEEQQKLLHHEGEKELEAIGERFQARFPDLLANYSSWDKVSKQEEDQEDGEGVGDLEGETTPEQGKRA